MSNTEMFNVVVQFLVRKRDMDLNQAIESAQNYKRRGILIAYYNEAMKINLSRNTKKCG